MASRRILIVGGVAGGASCAARLRRMDEFAEIFLFECGGDVSFANCGLPYYVGGEITDRRLLLVSTPNDSATSFASRSARDMECGRSTVEKNYRSAKYANRGGQPGSIRFFGIVSRARRFARRCRVSTFDLFHVHAGRY